MRLPDRDNGGGHQYTMPKYPETNTPAQFRRYKLVENNRYSQVTKGWWLKRESP